MIIAASSLDILIPVASYMAGIRKYTGMLKAKKAIYTTGRLAALGHKIFESTEKGNSNTKPETEKVLTLVSYNVE